MKNMVAAIKACEQATRNPGCLVRVTMTNVEQADVVLWVSNYLANTGMLDRDKTIANYLKENATIEVTNGSGIEFAFSEQAPAHPKEGSR